MDWLKVSVIQIGWDVWIPDSWPLDLYGWWEVVWFVGGANFKWSLHSHLQKQNMLVLLWLFKKLYGSGTYYANWELQVLLHRFWTWTIGELYASLTELEIVTEWSTSTFDTTLFGHMSHWGSILTNRWNDCGHSHKESRMYQTWLFRQETRYSFMTEWECLKSCLAWVGVLDFLFIMTILFPLLCIIP